MSSTIDVNILLYASDDASPHQASALELLGRLSEGPDIVYLFWPVLLGYIRIATHPAIFPNPLPVRTAEENVDQLVTLPHARTSGESPAFWDTYRTSSSGLVVAGNLVPDAHLVALARENGVGTIWSHDRDLRKFDGIRVRDPFA